MKNLSIVLNVVLFVAVIVLATSRSTTHEKEPPQAVLFCVMGKSSCRGRRPRRPVSWHLPSGQGVWRPVLWQPKGACCLGVCIYF